MAFNKAENHLADSGEKGNDPFEWMIREYGKEKGEYLYWASQAYNLISKIWECKDCAILDTDEYFEKRLRRI